MNIAREKIVREQSFDPVWFEQTFRAAAQKDTAALLESFLNHELPRLLPPSERRKDERFHSWRKRRVTTLCGNITLRRAYYVGTKGGRYPLDEQLGLHDQYTPAVAQLMCWAGAMDPSFQQASQTFERFAGLTIPDRQIQRVVQECAQSAEKWRKKRSVPQRKTPVPVLNIQTDMTGIPMRPEELRSIKGKQEDGSTKTRQIKVGCVFTQFMRASICTRYAKALRQTRIAVMLYSEHGAGVSSSTDCPASFKKLTSGQNHLTQ